MERSVREARFAVRRLARQPLFTLAAVATLALGIGATTAIFAVVKGVVLEPLPYPDADRLVHVGHRAMSGGRGMPDGGYLYYAEHATTLDHLAAYIEASETVTGTGEPLEIGMIGATPSLFATLGVTPAMGRGFTPDDAQPGAAPVAVISYGYWQRVLGGDPNAMGKPILEGARSIVVGILPPGFTFPRPEASVVFGNRFEEPDVYLPQFINPTNARFGNFMYQAVGRLAPGASPEAAQRELSRLMPQAAEAYPGSGALGGLSPEALREGDYTPVVTTLKDAIVGDLARVLWILMGAVGLVLLIAAANVANLFLVRAESRRGEIAVQRALGAGRGETMRSLVSESAILSAAGGVIGLYLAWLATDTLVSFAPADLPRLDQVRIDPSVAALALGLSLLLGLVLGVVPALRHTRVEVSGGLATVGRGRTATRAERRSQHGLVAFQVALSLMLLVGSGLLLRTFSNLRAVEPGFDPHNVLTLRLSLGEGLVRGAGYSDGPDDAVRSRFMLDLVSGLEELPGVERAAFTADLPLDDGQFYDYVAVEGALPEDPAQATSALRVFIGPGYLSTIGARFVAGRDLEAREFAEQPRSVVVNQAFARQRWPNEDPVGKRLLQYWERVNPDDDVWYTVVGVVEDIREASLMAPAEATVYLPTVFLPEGGFFMWISNMVAVLRMSVEPETLIPTVREAVHRFHPEIPITRIETLEQLTARSFQQLTFAMLLLIIAGVVSTVLALVGVYGTVAYVVSRRTREFGIRIAVGATSKDVRLSVLRQAGMMGGIGVALGVIGALLSGRVLESLLFGAATTDPGVILSVAAGLLLAVLGAALAPAVRAGRVDPVEAIRAE